jgi:UDP-N-acetylmuramoyl-tripeptide--D-alanyl-D-alanine ligase
MNGPRFTADELAAATGGRWIGLPPPAVEGVSTDTRKIAAGALFVALRGDRFDAHDFVAQALAAGAPAAVVSEAWAAGAPLAAPRAQGERTPALLAVPDTLAALGAIARHHRRRFAVPLVAVTGSVGKTSTREMIGAILRRRGPALKTEGNLNNEIGVPQTLFALAPEHWAGVVEMGMNHAGEIARLAAIAEPRVGVVTNAGVAHIEHLGSEDAIADAKGELYAALPRDGIAVANADDARVLKRAQASGRRLLTFAVGRKRRGDVVALEILEHGAEGLRFLLGVGNRELEVRLAIPGEHNAANAAAAAAAAVALGCSDREIVDGLADVRPVGRRMRVERLASGVTLLDDCYNANPQSMTAALATLRDLAARQGGRAVAALGDMLELGPESEPLHRALGAETARVASIYAAFGPRSTAAADAARAAGLAADAVFHTEDVAALAAFLRSRLAPGDVLLVKGSRGMQLERLVETLS